MTRHERSVGGPELQVGGSHEAKSLAYEAPMIIELGSIAGKTLQVSDQCQPGDPPPCP